MNRRPKHYHLKTPWFNRKYIKKVRRIMISCWLFLINFNFIFSREILGQPMNLKMNRVIQIHQTSFEVIIKTYEMVMIQSYIRKQAFRFILRQIMIFLFRCEISLLVQNQQAVNQFRITLRGRETFLKTNQKNRKILWMKNSQKKTMNYAPDRYLLSYVYKIDKSENKFLFTGAFARQLQSLRKIS